MSLLTELFGEEALAFTLEEVKEKIKKLPRASREKKAYLLKDFAAITGIKLIGTDFEDIEEKIS